MMNPLVTLFRKELRQNSFIYSFPLALTVLAFLFQKVLTQLLSATWARNFAVAIPVALAISYGLQAFDLEENNQTRDFLLTKPVTTWQIIAAKYYSGLAALLFLTVAWQLAFIPKLVCWPDLPNFSSFWFLAYLLLITIIYTAGFMTGAWVKGPKKIFAAIFASILSAIWFFFGWLEYLTSIYLSLVNDSFLTITAVLIGTLLFLIILIKVFLDAIINWMHNQPLTIFLPKLKTYILIFLFPLILYAINLYTGPEIRPFKSLFACMNGTEEWFQTVGIAKQPHGSLYALTDVRGRLGITKSGGKPIVIYNGEKRENNLLSQLAWSPDGAKIAFNENGRIKVLSLSEKKPLTLINGDIAFWSSDSNILLVAAKKEPSPTQAANLPASINLYRLSYVSLATKKKYELQGDLSFMGSSMFWNPDQNLIIVVTNYWELALMNLNIGKVEIVKLPVSQKPEPIFLSKISPSGVGSYRIAVFSNFKVAPFNKNSYRYNLNLYDFSLKSKKIVFKTRLKGLEFHDVLINAGDDQLWGGTAFGAYRKISLTHEVVKNVP